MDSGQRFHSFQILWMTAPRRASTHRRTTANGFRDSYTASVAGIPDGATITRIDITVCYKSPPGANTAGGTLQTFYRLNGADVGSGTDLTAAVAPATSTQNIGVTSG